MEPAVLLMLLHRVFIEGRAVGRHEGLHLRPEATPDDLPDVAAPIRERGHLSLHRGGGQPHLRVLRQPDPLVELGAAHPDEPPPYDPPPPPRAA